VTNNDVQIIGNDIQLKYNCEQLN